MRATSCPHRRVLTGNRQIDENRRRDEPPGRAGYRLDGACVDRGARRRRDARSSFPIEPQRGDGAGCLRRNTKARRSHEDTEAADGRRFARAWCGSARTSKNSAAVREVRPVRGSAGGGGVLARASGADAPPKHAGMAYTRSFHAAFHRTIDHPAPLLGRTFKVQTNHRKLLDVFQNRSLGNTKSIRHHLGLQPIVGFNHFQN